MVVSTLYENCHLSCHDKLHNVLAQLSLDCHNSGDYGWPLDFILEPINLLTRKKVIAMKNSGVLIAGAKDSLC